MSITYTRFYSDDSSNETEIRRLRKSISIATCFHVQQLVNESDFVRVNFILENIMFFTFSQKKSGQLHKRLV